MTRTFTTSADDEKPRIDKASVAKFFRERARKIDVVGAVRAVIYQDKHPDLAEKRDAAEKARMLPLLQLEGTQRVLDVGCGSGRWTSILVSASSYYHGIDFNADFVAHARASHPITDAICFSVAPAESYSLESLHETAPFDRILCCGVMIYLNDEDVESAFRCMTAVSARKARIVLREPVGIHERLTIKEHYSDELEQSYNAIYRTQRELEDLMAGTLKVSGFTLIAQGDVYDEHLNNRSETIQRWMVLERK